MDLNNHAVNILKHKNLEITESNINVVVKNLKERMNKRYNAVCVGIDGTLQISENLNDELIDNIFELLNKHIPIVFITGRGENGFKSFYNNMLDKLINDKGIKKELLKNIMAVTNDGSVLFYTSDIINEEGKIDELSSYLDKSKLLVNEKDLKKLLDIRKDIKSFFENHNINIHFRDSICDSLNKRFISFRIFGEDNNFEKLKEFIDYFVKIEKIKRNIENIYFTTGKFKEKDVIQFSASNKREALKIVEQFLGIPEDSILRVGDSGNEFGNDFSMLNCKQGYSVDLCSKRFRKLLSSIR